MELTAEELRVLGCLIEKSFTTPDQYPLTSNALTAACNQKTSRDPVVSYSTSLVDQTMLLLRDGGWARTVRSAGSRAAKHKQVVGEKLGIDDRGQAVLAVLSLRGAQSVGELVTRTERYEVFTNPEEVSETVHRLAANEPALAANIGRGPGQSQDRWVQLVGELPTGANQGDDPSAQQSAGGRPVPHRGSALEPARPNTVSSDEALVARIEALERRVADLESLIID